MNSIFIVSAENGGCPEKFIMGVYPTEELARNRIAVLEDENGDFCFEYAWFNEVKVGHNGADCSFCNR